MEAVVTAQKAGKLRYIGFTGHKDPHIHLYMLKVAAEHGFHFDTVQMPLNVMDAHFRSFAHMVLPELVKQEIGVLGMKSMGDGVILKSKTVTPIECLHYALSLPTSVVITGIDKAEILNQAFEAAKTFQPMNREDIAQLLAKTKKVACPRRRRRRPRTGRGSRCRPRRCSTPCWFRTRRTCRSRHCPCAAAACRRGPQGRRAAARRSQRAGAGARARQLILLDANTGVEANRAKHDREQRRGLLVEPLPARTPGDSKLLLGPLLVAVPLLLGPVIGDGVHLDTSGLLFRLVAQRLITHSGARRSGAATRRGWRDRARRRRRRRSRSRTRAGSSTRR